jgi:hypothetical protein
MRLTVTKKIGKKTYHFQIEGTDLHEVIREENKLSFPDVAKCGLCGSDNLSLQARIAGKKKHKYTYVKCFNCKGELTFGRKQEDPEVFYLRKDELTGKPFWQDVKAMVEED